MWKGIVLAGGAGSRLYPMTSVVTKQLLPVYDKPMIYYPLSTLMLTGIREILIISTPQDTPVLERLLGDGRQLGLKLSYQVQPRPEGIAQAFIIGRQFIGQDNVCLILGDNIFYGHGLPETLSRATGHQQGAVIFGYPVQDPWRYGVVEFDDSGRVIGIQEKPANPPSSYAVPGIYFYDCRVVEIAAALKPSARGELEITDVNMAYLQMGKLRVELLGRGMAWLDTGTPESLLEASEFIAALEKRQGLKVACLEEVAYRMGYIDRAQLEQLCVRLPANNYRRYLEALLAAPGFHDAYKSVAGG